MIESVDIKDLSGITRFSTPINEGSKRKFLLMKEDYITLKFSVGNPIYFKLGDGIDNELGVFELVDLCKPTFNQNTGGYDYELRLDAYYWKWKNKKFFFTPEQAGREASWNLTANLDTHMEIFRKNLKALGYKFRESEFICEIGDTVENSSKLVSYDNCNLIDALTQMAEAWECEWWITNHTINFGRCEYGDPVDFKVGDSADNEGVNVNTMQRSDSQATYATRIYAFGSTRNIPPTYRKKLVFDVKEVDGRDISDTARKLDAKFFPFGFLISPDINVIYDKAERKTYPNSPAEHTTYIPISDLSAGTNKISEPILTIATTPTSGGKFWGAEVTLGLACNISGSPSNRPLKIVPASFFGDQKIQLRATFENISFDLEGDATECKLYITWNKISFDWNNIDIVFYDSINAVIQNALKSASANVNTTFTTGSNKGKTFSAVYNPDFLTGDESNIIRLPEGITASTGDTYTIDNIIKSKVPSSYFTSSIAESTVEGIVTKHLMLPEGIPYIDAYEGMTQEEAVEEVVVFDDVFAKREGEVGEVFTHPYTDIIDNADGTKTENKWNAYRFKDADLGFHFSKDYILPTGLMVDFQTGSLAGMSFEVLFNNYDKVGDTLAQPEKNENGTWNSSAQVYEIKRNDTYGRELPDEILMPKRTNKYILHGYDTAFVSESYIPNAETKLLEKAKEYVEKSKIDPSTYDCSMASDYIFGIDPETGDLNPLFAKHFGIGDKVNLINKTYFEEGRQSRIIGFEYKLDIPYDSPVYTIGETASYSRLGALESKIDSITHKEVSVKGTGSYGSSSGGGIGGGNGNSTKDKLSIDLQVNAPPTGFIKTGDTFLAGTDLEEVFISMLSKKAEASLKHSLSTPNDVEFGSAKGMITYTAIRNGQGPMKKSYYDDSESNALNFSEEVGGVQTTTRQLSGNYTVSESYTATVVYSESEDKKLPEKTLTDRISVNVRRKWFAGVCNSAPVTSSDVRLLGTSGLYAGPGTYKFNTVQWKTVAVCIPEGSVTDISIASSTGNFVENGKVCTGPITISVEGANGSAAINYKMWIVRTEGTNDPDSFTFKTI